MMHEPNPGIDMARHLAPQADCGRHNYGTLALREPRKLQP
jgi:hypothetical protein